MKNESIYIFSWNGGKIVEKHTEKTFKKKYNKKSNIELWEKSYLELGNNSNCIMEDLFKVNELGHEETRHYDNMFVIRLDY